MKDKYWILENANRGRSSQEKRAERVKQSYINLKEVEDLLSIINTLLSISSKFNTDSIQEVVEELRNIVIDLIIKP